MATIQIKRGVQQKVDELTLLEGELAVALDTGNVYIGTNAGKTHLNPTVQIPTKISHLTNDLQYQKATDVDSKIAELVSSSPEALNTLKELADALGNDPNFAATVTTEIGKKEPLLKNATDKTKVVDGDKLVLIDGDETKKTTLTDFKEVLKVYFDTLYNNYILPTASADTKGGILVGNGLTISGDTLNIGNIDGGNF